MILITGGAGYLGSIIRDFFLSNGKECISLDIVQDNYTHQKLKSLVIDITDLKKLEEEVLAKYQITTIIHCAALLQVQNISKERFDLVNVKSTGYLAELAVKYKIKNFIYISSNCVYGQVDKLNITEDTELLPFEEYGVSKAKSEQILYNYNDKLNISILRCPTIISEGRLGILSIVFDFIRENKKLWLVGKGGNKYQFIYGKDVAFICDKLIETRKNGIFNIGTNKIESLNEIFQNLINHAGSKSKIKHLPAKLMLPLMKLCYHLGISPLGPYQYNMINHSYSGDISKLIENLGWSPKLSNSEILVTAYDYYIKNLDTIQNNKNLTGHKRTAKAGIINILKWLS